jgi:hypothetical protein
VFGPHTPPPEEVEDAVRVAFAADAIDADSISGVVDAAIVLAFESVKI